MNTFKVAVSSQLWFDHVCISRCDCVLIAILKCTFWVLDRSEKEKEEVHLIPIAFRFDFRVVAAPAIVYTPSPGDTEYKVVSTLACYDPTDCHLLSPPLIVPPPISTYHYLPPNIIATSYYLLHTFHYLPPTSHCHLPLPPSIATSHYLHPSSITTSLPLPPYHCLLSLSPSTVSFYNLPPITASYDLPPIAAFHYLPPIVPFPLDSLCY